MIAFTSQRDGNNEIYVMKADGSNQQNVTNNLSASDTEAAVSPDGTKIAFATNRDGNFQIYAMNLDGSGLVNLSQNSSDDRVPAWSPDGTKITFRSNRDGNREVYVMNADGTNQTQLTFSEFIDDNPSWSPDGTKIAFESTRDGDAEIWVMSSTGANPTQLTFNTTGDTDPSWSSTNQVLFERGGDIWVMNSDGANQTNLTNNGADDTTSAWSPDGAKIAFATNRAGDFEIYVMNADGTDATRFTNATGNDTLPSWAGPPDPPPPDTDVGLDGFNNLVITDAGGVSDDSLTIARNGASVRVHDPGNTLAAGAGATQIDANTVEVLLASITGDIQFDLLDGSDTLTVDHTGGDIGKIINYDGGDATAGPGDKLVVTGGSFGTVTHNLTGADAGNLSFTGASMIAYTGLEPVDITGTDADNLVFNLPAGGSAAFLEDDGLGNGISQLRSNPVSFELTTFSNPNLSLTIQRGNAGDVLTIGALPDFDRTLTVGSAGNEFALVDIAGAVALATDFNLSVEATTIALSSGSSQIGTLGSGAIGLTALRNIVLTAGSSMSTVDGGITLLANQDITPMAGDFVGIDVDGGAISTSGAGSLLLQGRGGDDLPTQSHFGVSLRNGALVSSAGSGTVTLIGAGGAGSDHNAGVSVEDTDSQVTSATGDIQIIGTGGNGQGVRIFFGGVISSTGTAKISINGTGGPLYGGVDIIRAQVISLDGDIDITGIGGNGVGGAFETGVYISFLGQVISTGAATINIHGTGGTGTDAEFAYGVDIEDIGSVVSDTGDILIIGIGGGGGPTSSGDNVGVFINGNSQIVSNGTATITIDGTGGAGLFENHGVEILNSFSGATSVDGDIRITGRAGGSTAGSDNLGVFIWDDARVTATGNAAIFIDGAGGAGTANNDGVEFSGADTLITTLDGDITIGGTAGADSLGFDVNDVAAVTTTGAGSIAVAADSINMDATAAIDAGNNTVALTPATVLTQISLGGADAAGVLGLTDDELDRITAGTLIIGSTANAGAILLTDPIDVTDGPAIATLLLQTGDAIIDNTGGEQTDITANALLLQAATLGTTAAGDLDFAAASLTTDTAGAGGNQFLSEADAVSVVGIDAGAGTVELLTGNFELSASDVLADATFFNVAGATLGLGAFDDAVAGVTLIAGAVTGTTGTLTSASDFDVRSGTISAALAGNVALTKATTGAVTLSGIAANVYTGLTTVSDGILLLDKSDGVNSVPGDLTVGDNGSNRDEVRLESHDQIADTSAVTLNGPLINVADGFLNLTLYSERIGSLSGDGVVFMGSDSLANTFTVGDAANTTFAGNITSGSEDIDRVVKVGAGILVLSGAISFLGFMDVDEGTLQVDGSIASSSRPVTVGSGATLAGSGTINRPVVVNGGGAAAPGSSPGLLNTGSIDFSNGGAFTAEVNGPAAGAEHDQLNVTGAVTLGAGVAVLNLVGGFLNSAADQVVLINNDAADPVNGFFAGYPQGAEVVFGSFSGLITYAGGDGNDVVLVVARDTAVDLTGGNLIVTDIRGGDSNDDLILSRVGANVRIHDPVNTLEARGGATQVDEHTVEAPFASLTGNIQFDALAGDDRLRIDYAGGNPVPAGGAVFTAGANGLAGDRLAILGSGTQTATYTPHASITGDGTVVVNGATIAFTGLEPLDLTGMATANVAFPNANETLTIANGVDSTMGGGNAALNVTGNSGGVVFESVALWNNGAVNISTTNNDGNDSVDITGASVGGNGKLLIDTGTGMDSLRVLGAVSFTGDIRIESTSMTVAAAVQSTGAGSIYLFTDDSGGTADSITLNALVSSVGGTVTVSADDDLVQNNDLAAMGASDIVVIANHGSITMAASASTNSGGGNVGYSAPFGGLALSALATSGDVILLSSAAAGSGISDVNGAAVNIRASRMRMFSRAGIGSGNALEITVSELTAQNTTSGDIELANSGALNITAVNVSAATPFGAIAGGGLLGVENFGGNVAISADALTLSEAVFTFFTATLVASTGAISDNNGAAVNVRAASTALSAASGIGAGDSLELAVSNLEAAAQAGGVFLGNSRALTIGGVSALDGVFASGGDIVVSAASPLTVAENVVGAGSITLSAGETDDDPFCADDLTANAAVTVQSTGGSITLNAGDDIVLGAGVSIAAAVNLDLNAGFNDLDNCGDLLDSGASLNAGLDLAICVIGDLAVGAYGAGDVVSLRSLSGAINDGNGPADNVTAAALAMRSATGIGLGDALETVVNNLEALTDTGGIVLTNNGALIVGDVTPAPCVGALGGLDVSTSGNISLLATIDLSLIEGISAPGRVELTALSGSMIDLNGAATDVAATDLAATAGVGVGAAGDTLETAAARFEAAAGAGGVFVRNNGGLTVGGVLPSLAGVTATGAGISIVASSLLLIDEDVLNNGSGNVVLQAGESAAAGDDLTVGLASSVAITAAGGDIFLLGGDNISLSGTTTVSASGAINIQGDVGDADIAGSTIRVNNTTIAGASLSLSGGNDNDTFDLDQLSLALSTRIQGAGGAADVATLDFVSVTGAAGDGLLGQELDGVTVNHGSFLNNDGNGLVLQTAGAVILNTVIANANHGAGVIVNGAASLRDDNGVYTANFDHGLSVTDIAGSLAIANVTADNNDADDDGTGDGLHVADGGDGDAVSIGGTMQIVNSFFRGDGARQQSGIVVAHRIAASTLLIANSVTGNWAAGLAISGGTFATLIGGAYSNNGGSGIALGSFAGAVDITAVTANGNGGDGIALTSVGAVTLNTVIANGNDPGVNVNGVPSFADIDGVYSNNLDHGILLANIAGDVTLTRTTADNNDRNDDGIGDGVHASLGGNLLVLGGRFRDAGGANDHQERGIFIGTLGGAATFQDSASPQQSIIVTGNEGGGVLIADGGSSASFTGGTYSGNSGHGISVASFSNAVTMNMVAASSNRAATLAAGVAVFTVGSLTDTAGIYNGNDDGGILAFDVAGDITLIRTTADNNDADDDTIGDGFMAFDGGDVDGLAIGGNLRVQGGNYRDLGGVADHQMRGVYAASVAGAVIFQDSAGPVQAVTVTGNEHNGVEIGDGGTTASFTGGVYANNAATGILLSSLAGAVTMNSASVSGNGSIGAFIITAGAFTDTAGAYSGNANGGILVADIAGNVTLTRTIANNNDADNNGGDGFAAIDGGDGDSLAIGGNLLVEGGVLSDTDGAGTAVHQQRGVFVSGIGGNVSFQDAAAPSQFVTVAGNRTNGVAITGAGNNTAAFIGGVYSGNGGSGVRLASFNSATFRNLLANANTGVGVDVANVDTINLSDLIMEFNGSGIGGNIVNAGSIRCTPTTTGAVIDTINVTATQFQHTRAADVQQPVTYAGVVNLDIVGLAGADIFNVQGTSANTTLNGGADDDVFNVSSDAPLHDGNLDAMQGQLTIEAGLGTLNALFVSDQSGAANASVVLLNNGSTNVMLGLAPAPIVYRATGGQFNVAGGDGVVIRGSDSGSDFFTILSTIAGSTTRIEGLGGADTFTNDFPGNNHGDLDAIAGRLTLIGGAPGPLPSLDCGANPLGSRDVLLLNDRADPGAHNYNVGPNGIASATPRVFAGVIFDASMDYVRLDGTDLANVFDVVPSLTTQFYLDGNLPSPGECSPGGGDFLRLNTTGTNGRKINIDAPGQGDWTFTSGHRDVCFESIERFNHVDILAVANDNGPPIVKVYDAETMDFRFQVWAYPAYFRGGVRVATGDVNCDGLPDLITASGPGRTTVINVYDGAPNADGQHLGQRLASFDAFSPQFKGGAFVAIGDVNNDGAGDIIVGADRGWLPLVRVVNGATLAASPSDLIAPFIAYANHFRGGVRVAAGDINGDGFAEIVTATGPTASGVVNVYDGVTQAQVNSFAPFGASLKNGLYVAVGDVNGDGIRDIVASADKNWLPMVSVFDGGTVYRQPPAAFVSILAFGAGARTGVRITLKPIDGGAPGSVEKTGIVISSGPAAGRVSRRIRRAVLNSLTPSVVDRVFENSRVKRKPVFDGVYLG